MYNIKYMGTNEIHRRNLQPELSLSKTLQTLILNFPSIQKVSLSKQIENLF